MTMTSLKQKYSETYPSPSGSDDDEYFPSLHLEGKKLDELGVGSARVGDEMIMVATVRVSSMSESKGGSRSMSFEIIEAEIKPKDKQADAASVLFPNG